MDSLKFPLNKSVHVMFLQRPLYTRHSKYLPSSFFFFFFGGGGVYLQQIQQIRHIYALSGQSDN